jgi:hypothetical protein
MVIFTPQPLYPGERAPGTHWIGGWVGPRAGLENVEKRKFLTFRDSNSDPSVTQPVASRYTTYTLPAHSGSHSIWKYETAVLSTPLLMETDSLLIQLSFYIEREKGSINSCQNLFWH